MTTYSLTVSDAQQETATQVVDNEETVLFRFIELHLGDWIGGTMAMSCEHEGAYIRFLARLYQRGKPLPDDDRFMATCMNLSLRVWKRVKEALIACGKIVMRAGHLTNSRFERERLKRAEQIKKQAESARKRWSKDKGLAEVSSKLAPNLAQTSAKLAENFAEKLNEINVEAVITDMPPLPSTLYPIKKEEERSKDLLFNEEPLNDVPADKPKRRKAAVPEEYTHDFDAFWAVYPRRQGKGEAFKSWQRLTLAQKRKAYLALKDQKASLEEEARNPRGNFCPMPATWINQGRFDDETVAPRANGNGHPYAAPRMQTFDEIRQSKADDWLLSEARRYCEPAGVA